MLTACTFTGVDADTDIAALSALAADHPFAEFGVLLSRTQPGHDFRYPFPAEMEAILCRLEDAPFRPALALHVCGGAVREFVAGSPETLALASRFDRVQLNFTIDRSPFGADELAAAIARFGKPVITQHNAANEALSPLLDVPGHQVLFDASGGRGHRVDGWPSPIAGKRCGYAGGIGPDTIADDVARAADAAGGADHWIDMENRVRTPGNRLDLSACARVLDVVAAHAGPRAVAGIR